MRLIALMLSVLPCIASGASPREDFNDDTLVLRAVADVRQMSAPEVDAFISFVASCDVAEGGDVQAFYCAKERESYLLKYERGRALDRLIRVLSVTWRMIEATGKTASPHSKVREEAGSAIMRYADVTGKLKDAVNLRSRFLLK